MAVRTEMRTQMQGLHEQQSGLAQEVRALRAAVQGLAGEVQQVRAEVQRMREAHARQRTIQIERVERLEVEQMHHTIGHLDVEQLDGTLNVGFSRNLRLLPGAARADATRGRPKSR